MRYKVCVYAISKNEEKNVTDWVKSMSEADEIYVMDTGSTDNTVKLFPRDCSDLVEGIQQSILEKTGKHVEVMV